MKSIWHPYHEWECFHAGMYDGPCELDEDDGNLAYADFLSDLPRFRAAMDGVVRRWPLSCEHFLTKPGNIIAWMGQASACYDMGIPRKYRYGFNLLSIEDQKAANEAARQKIAQWNAEKNPSVRSEVEGAGVPGRHTGRSAVSIDALRPSPVLQSDSDSHTQERSPNGGVGLQPSQIEMVQ